MKTTTKSPILIFSLALLTLAPEGRAQDISRQKIIVFKNKNLTAEQKQSLLEQAGGEALFAVDSINAVVGYFPYGMDKSLAKSSLVGSVEDDAYVKLMPTFTGSDPRGEPGEDMPWGVASVWAPDVWGLAEGNGVKVCVVDSGIDREHFDLKANIAGGKNFWDDPSNPGDDYQDELGHGTHVTGIIAASRNNLGLVGVAPQSFIYVSKVFGPQGFTSISRIIAGVDYCISVGAQVVNMSLGTYDDFEAFHAVIRKAYDQGVVLVAAAGNSSIFGVAFPAAYPEVISVAALDENNQPAWFSSRGERVDLIAPGVDVPSTYPPGSYRGLSGTSMASPHVAGIAALFLSYRPGTDSRDVKHILKSTAIRLDGVSPFIQGAGVTNAYRTLLMIKREERRGAIN
ncbi:MAG: S8 family peptidase [Elusimicrobia bacterium]|nr:S8 family peptidase [Elusimicrobiota bacterium]